MAKSKDKFNMQTTGVVLSNSKQWWIKINLKPFRKGRLDGTIFLYVIKVKYIVNGREYKKRKWINAGLPVPKIGENVLISYNENNPKKAKVIIE